MNEKEDVWEEEIDLRELASDVISWWWLWIGLPILIGLATGVYMYQQPDRYEITATIRGDFSAQEVNQLGFDPIPEGQLETTLAQSGANFSNLSVKSDSNFLKTEYQVKLNSSEPEALQKQLTDLSFRSDSWVRTFQEHRTQRLEALREEVELHQRKLSRIADGLEGWLNEVRAIRATENLQDAGLDAFASSYRVIHFKLSEVKEAKDRVSETSSDFLGKLSYEKDSLESNRIGPNRYQYVFTLMIITLFLGIFGVFFSILVKNIIDD